MIYMNPFRASEQCKKAGLIGSMLFFLGLQFVVFFGVPAPVHAQTPPAPVAGPGVPTVVTTDLPATADDVLEYVGEILYAAALGAVVQGASYFMRKLAYDTASYIASGGKGQAALVFQDGFGAYLENTALDTAAEAIDQLGKGFGMDLCQPPDLDFQANLKIGLSEIYEQPTLGGDVPGAGGPQPNCSFQTLSDNWESGANDNFGIDSAANFADSLRIGQTDLGVALESMVRIDELQVAQKNAAELERLVGNGYKPLTDIISGDIKTPAAVIEEETKSVTAKHQGELTAGQISGIYGAGATQILPMAASVFMNTLVSQLLSNLLEEGLVPTRDDGSALDFYDAGAASNRQAAQRAFHFLLAGTASSQGTFESVNELFKCNANNRGLYDCSIDGGLRDALVRADQEDPMTIQEAIDASGFLYADRPLISPRNEALNADPDCRNENYCYSNIKKLRKLRILPLGFEIAALRSDPDSPWTLGEVVAGYEDCTRNSDGIVVPDPQKPFCHLINPNWILRAPKARCEAQVFGEQLLNPNVPTRNQVCADVSTCIERGPNGECLDDFFSYCTAEKNVWNFPGAQMCKEQFSTCRTYKDSEGQISVLSRTVDYGECRADNIGCRAYSLEKDGAGEWVASPQVNLGYKDVGRNQAAYFSDNLRLQGKLNCPDDAEGCHAFYPVDSQGGVDDADPIYLKKAPDYLGCYDTNDLTPEIDYPQTAGDLALLPDTEVCSAGGEFATVCLPEEVGCQGYTPKNDPGAPEIPGVIGNNACKAECVGYDAYQQEGSNFDETLYPLYFRPQDAKDNMAAEGQACTEQEAGCEEFTNLSEASGGGEKREYYTYIKYCEQPEEDAAGNVTNLETFYSWEGSASEGFVLRIHKLRPTESADIAYMAQLGLSFDVAGTLPLGSPMYADDRKASLEEAVETCNATTYEASLDAEGVHRDDPDCRALFDAEQKVYYRLMSRTITVDAACHGLRKTDSNLYNEAALDGTEFCLERGGIDVGGKCMRCYNGGRFEGTDDAGACVYQAMTGTNESNTCRPKANGCREYTGSGSGDVFSVFLDDFEGDPIVAKSGWESSDPDKPRVVSESTVLKEQSLLVEADTVDAATALRRIDAGNIEFGRWYELSFWVRGKPQTLSIALTQGSGSWSFTTDSATDESRPVTVGDGWKRVSLGTVQFLGDSSSDVTLVFQAAGIGGATPGDYFIDNIELQQVNDREYLIKDSWRQVVGEDITGEQIYGDVAKTCDDNPFDGLPGHALGCREYEDRDPNTDTQYATGFETLCREEAIGCAALIDTYNTLEGQESAQAQAFNVWCAVPAGDVEPAEQTCQLERADGVDVSEYKCVVPPNGTGCYIDKVVIPVGENNLSNFSGYDITNSTIIIPADSENPVYLTDKDEYRCDQNNLGCQQAGIEKQELPDEASTSFTHKDILLRNQPDSYIGDGGILCREEHLACGAFKSGNQISYFKDPRLSGDKLCEYRERSVTDSESNAGWFIKDVGRCGGVDSGGSLCRLDSDCEAGVACEPDSIGNVPCYDDYFVDAGMHGIWSSGSAGYDGFVGLCPPTQNMCTELIDPADTSFHEDGKPYYVIFDDRVTRTSARCEGKVGLREGCVLFDKTENPDKRFSSELTYGSSEKKAEGTDSNQFGFSLVAPESGSGNDANIILGVARDRVCSEWLTCKDWTFTVDEDTNRPRRLCSQFVGCRDATAGGECLESVQLDDEPTRLTYTQYVQRDTDWYAEERSGYSILGQYQIPYLSSIHMHPDDPYTYLVYDAGSDVECQTEEAPETEEDLEKIVPCGNEGGRCVSGRCVYPIARDFPGDVETRTEAREHMLISSCKAPPESTSPFATSLVSNDGGERKWLDVDGSDGWDDGEPWRKEFTEKAGAYSNANVCQDGNCSCQYTKIQYRNAAEIDYWPYGYNDAPTGVCSGLSEKFGQPCESSSDCVEFLDGLDTPIQGTCNLVQKKESRLGQQGFCLEYDYATPLGDIIVDGKTQDNFACVTWLPIESNAAPIDIYNLDPNAGFYPPTDADHGNLDGVYCTDSTGIDRVHDRSEWTYDGALDASDFIKSFDNMTSDKAFCLGRTLVTPASTLPDKCINPLHSSYIEVDNFYMTMQSWAEEGISEVKNTDGDVIKEAIGLDKSNATVLRIEKSMTTQRKIGNWDASCENNPFIGKDHYGKTSVECGANQTNAVKSGSKTKITPYSFLPRVFSFEIPGEKTDENEWGCHSDKDCGGHSYFWRTIGTVHHPPRLWTPEEYSGEVTTDFNYVSDIRGEVHGAKTSWGVSSLANAPGPRYVPDSPFDNMETALYRSRFEAAMTESDLGKVYFVPIAYPGGEQDQNPVWLDKEIYIDFNLLTSREQKDLTAIDGRKVDRYRTIDLDDVDDGTCDTVITFMNPICGVTDGAKVITYKLTRDSGGGPHEYIDSTHYPDSKASPATSAQFKTLETDERNKVYSRYILLWYEEDEGEVHSSIDWVKKAPNIDPFAKEYKSGEDTPPIKCDKNIDSKWFALGMDFNSDGEFLGYVSRWCSANKSDGDDDTITDPDDVSENGVNMAVVAELNNVCTEYHTVFEGAGEDKAWTNRVWDGGAQYPDPVRVPKSQPITPYGATDFAQDSVSVGGELAMRTHWLPAPTVNEAGAVTDPYGFPLGVPYNCSYPLLDNTDDGGIYGTCLAKGALNSNTGGDVYLRQLFAKSYKVGKRYKNDWTGNPEEWLLDNDIITSQQDDSFALGQGFAPKIFSLDPSTCNDEGKVCTPGEEDNFTINGANGTLNDYNGDGIPDQVLVSNNGVPDYVIKEGGEFVATAEFFAYADDNHMPIRRIVIDWDDGFYTNKDRKTGMYQNAKPVCETDNSGNDPDIGHCGTAANNLTPLTCEINPEGVNGCPILPGGNITDRYTCFGKGEAAEEQLAGTSADSYQIPRFGDVPRACTTKPFAYSHAYSCSEGDGLSKSISTWQANGDLSADQVDRLVARGLSVDDPVCVFVPGVQVLDNWGFCNGVDESGNYFSFYGGQCNGIGDPVRYTRYKGKVILVPKQD